MKSVRKNLCPRRGGLNSKGFTLFEILVALAVLAIALFAVVKVSSENAANAAYLRNKTFAHWTAMNKVAEIQLFGEWPAPGTSQGTSAMVDRDWYWITTVVETEDKEVRRIEVQMRSDEAAQTPLATLTAFVGKPR